MRRGRRKLVVGVWAGLALTSTLAVVLAFAARPSAARSASGCTSSWRVVVPAPVGKVASASSFGWTDVAAESATDAWAVFHRSDLIEHWDGVHWSLSQPNSDKSLAKAQRVLTGVAAASPSAAWAVGYNSPNSYNPSTETRTPLLESWDGTSWQVDQATTLRGAWLNSVVAVSATDVWAVGARAVRTTHGLIDRTLIEHWDGTTWRVVPSPNIGPATYRRTRFGWTAASDNELMSVAAVSADDIWAVGDAGRALRRYKSSYQDFTLSSLKISPLAEHWDGTAWKLGPATPYTVHPKNGNPIDPSLYGFTDVTTTPSGNVLALAPNWKPLWQLNGSLWTQLQIPSQVKLIQPDAVASGGPDDIWLLGQNATYTVGDNWDGNQWSQIKLPRDGFVNTASQSPTGDIWAAGNLGVGAEGPRYPLLHYTC